MSSPDTMKRNQARTAHYILQWRVPREILVRPNLSGAELAILEFPPKGRRETWRYATNGMSEYAQQSPHGELRTEIYTCSRNQTEWVIELLDILSRYPMRYETYFADFDTIELARGTPSPFAGIILGPPEPEDAEALGEIPDVLPSHIIVYRVVGILEDELNYAIEQGGDALWKLLLKLSKPLLIDEARESAVKQMKEQ